MKNMKWLLPILILAVLAACSPSAPAAPTQPAAGTAQATQPAAASARSGNLVMATGASTEPASMDAQVDPYAITWLMDSWVSDPLVQLTSAGEYKPFLATAWQLSPDNLTWTFTLRKGVKFQDGTDFNAQAVKFNIDRVMDPDTKSALMAN